MDRALTATLLAFLPPYSWGKAPYSRSPQLDPSVALGKGTEPVCVPPRVDGGDERHGKRRDDVVLGLPGLRAHEDHLLRVALALRRHGAQSTRVSRM